MPPTRTLNIRRSVGVGNRPGTSGPLGSFHNLRAPGSIHLPARYLDAAEEDDLEPDSENPDDDGNDEDAASEDSDFYPS